MRDRPALDLFLISWLVLFLELACIRWFPSHVLFLTFFTNTVLLACFVGMSIGCLVARGPNRLINLTPYLLAVAVAAGLLTDRFSHQLAYIFAVGNQANPEEVFFGTEGTSVLERSFTIPIEVVGALFFMLIAAVMVGPGQEMGRAFNRVPNRTTAYSANLLGSLARDRHVCRLLVSASAAGGVVRACRRHDRVSAAAQKTRMRTPARPIGRSWTEAHAGGAACLPDNHRGADPVHFRPGHRARSTGRQRGPRTTGSTTTLCSGSLTPT